MAKLGYMSGPEYSVLPNPFNVNRRANVTPRIASRANVTRAKLARRRKLWAGRPP